MPRQGIRGQYLELVGSPDLLMEIVSKGSVRKAKRHEVKLERVRHRLGLWRYTLHARPI